MRIQRLVSWLALLLCGLCTLLVIVTIAELLGITVPFIFSVGYLLVWVFPGYWLLWYILKHSDPYGK